MTMTSATMAARTLAVTRMSELRHSRESQVTLARRHGICTATIYLIRKGAIHREAA
jgi:hypothetical protein